jgi:hypothetical protein
MDYTPICLITLVILLELVVWQAAAGRRLLAPYRAKWETRGRVGGFLLILLSVGPAESRLTHCSLSRLIVLNPVLVSPFISRGVRDLY